LHVHAKPSAQLHLFESEPPLMPNGISVNRYTTRRGVVFEEHITHDGKVTWFKQSQPAKAQTQ
jgi:hypothetical protein